MDIIDKIVTIRKQRGISQQKLSEMTGILQPVIARVESKKSSPTIEFLSKVLTALDLELSLVDSFESPRSIKKIINGLPHKRINTGTSGDKVFVFGEKYLLKISNNTKQLRLEKEKNEWVSQYTNNLKTIQYIEEDMCGYYLREYIRGHTLIEEQYIKNPNRLINILKEVVIELRKMDSFECPFSSLDSIGNDFVHGDLCLPNILVDDNDHFIGFIDLSACGKGDKQYDYCWLLWSFEYNLKTKQYSDLLLKNLNVEIDAGDYLRYVVLKMIDKSGNY